MTYLKTKVLVCSALALIASGCAKSGGTSSPSTTTGGTTGGGTTGGTGGSSKAVLSSWTASTGIGLVFDLSGTGGNLTASTFSAVLSYQGSICTYSLQLGAANTTGNCVITTAPVFSGSTSAAFASSSDCTTNLYNICGTGAATGSGTYNWDGTGLSFSGNNTQYR